MKKSFCLKQCSHSISMYFGGLPNHLAANVSRYSRPAMETCGSGEALGLHDLLCRAFMVLPAGSVEVNLHRLALLIYGNNQSDTSDCLVLKRFLFQQNFQLKNL